MSGLSTRITRRPLTIAVTLALGLSMGNAHAASITVTDGGDAGTPTTCTLRQAIEAANTDAAVGACTAGAGADNISFNAALVNATITLGGTELLVTDDLTITGSGQTIDANGASRVLNLASSTNLTASNLSITGGATSGYNGGGGIYAYDASTLTLTACTISGNSSSDEGGGIYMNNDNVLVVTDSIITGNTTHYDGGGIHMRDRNQLTVTNSTITGNTSGGDGGGIYINDDNQLTVTNSIVTGNTAANDGGGIYVDDDSIVTINTSIIRDNTAGDEGGGINVDDRNALTVSNSTISGNIAGREGGGIYVDDLGVVSITNTTISHNQAGQEGGGIYVDDEVSLTVRNSTITANHSDTAGGGIYSDATIGTITLQNTILSGNTALGDADLGINLYGGGASVTAAASLLGTTLSGAYPGNGNVFSNTPGLGALANNGGPTPTMLPLAGSPAVDAGNNALIAPGVTFDQRGAGFPRIAGGRVDIGAVEAAAASAFAPKRVPAGSTWSLGLLGVLLGTLGWFGLRRRQQEP